MSLQSNRKPALGQQSTLKKQVTTKLEPAKWSGDTGQQMPCFDRCQLTITWMSNIKERGYKSRLYVSGVWSMEYGRHLAWLCRHRRGAHTPTSNTASHNNYQKINSWVSFSFLYGYGDPLGSPLGRRSSPILRCYRYIERFTPLSAYYVIIVAN